MIENVMSWWLYCSNSISSVGGEALAGLLLKGSPLEELYLQGNRICDAGASAFALALRRTSSLQLYVVSCLICALRFFHYLATELRVCVMLSWCDDDATGMCVVTVI